MYLKVRTQEELAVFRLVVVWRFGSEKAGNLALSSAVVGANSGSIRRGTPAHFIVLGCTIFVFGKQILVEALEPLLIKLTLWEIA